VEIASFERHSPDLTQNPASKGSGAPFSGSEQAAEAARIGPHPEKKIDVLHKNDVSSCIRKLVELRDE
jgi:hypothetical protein